MQEIDIIGSSSFSLRVDGLVAEEFVFPLKMFGENPTNYYELCRAIAFLWKALVLLYQQLDRSWKCALEAFLAGGSVPADKLEE